MKKLVRNAIRCKLCGDVIESNSVHDFKMCKCGACYIDGGLEYQRIGGNYGNWENLSEFDDVPGYYVTHWTMYGGRYTYATTDDPVSAANNIENMWGMCEIKNEDGEIVYQTKGLDDFLAKKGKR